MRKVAKKVVMSMMIIHLLCGCSSFTEKSAHQNSQEGQRMDSLEDLLNAQRRERDEKKAIHILRKDPSLATQTWDGEDDILIKGSTALHYAAHYDYMDLVKLLVEHGADVNASEAHWWTPPLAWAADAARAEVVKFLLDNGAEVNADVGGGHTALHAASQGGSTQGHERTEDYRKTAELLIEYGAKVDAKTNDGFTPLANAIRAGNKAVEEVLRQHGANCG